jgi:hypothetical protein
MSTAVPPTHESSALDGPNAAMEWAAVSLSSA